jgi:hypothetical protein
MSLVKAIIPERLGGEQPSPFLAGAGGAVAGTVAGVLVYKLLRR